MEEVAIAPVDPEEVAPDVGPERARDFIALLAHLGERLRGRTLWSVNSTAQGGGVAEILSSVLSYLVGAGIDARWLALDGNDEFFELTKGLHHLLHGDAWSASDLGPADVEVYESTLAGDAGHLLERVAPGDPVILHDPQVLGLAPALAERGAVVIWSCHVGADRPNRWTRAAWEFLGRYLGPTERQTFSRSQYIWENVEPGRAAVIPPCIDALSPKNRELDEDTVARILAVAGIVPRGQVSPVILVGRDGSPVRVERRCEILQDGALEPGVPIVTQVSRWDPLKDHPGVMRGFAEHVAPRVPAHLVLAGPAMGSVSDDPEERSSFDELVATWKSLPDDQRARVHIVCLPMDDLEENALMVNALQRRSDVVVQKSLAEGFGLTVAEAMWKGRPTVGSRVGGVQDQIVHGESGLLLDDPTDLAGFGEAVTTLLEDRACAERLGAAAVRRVREEYLAPCYLTRFLHLVDEVLDAGGPTGPPPGSALRSPESLAPPAVVDRGAGLALNER